ncbi:unnamed protein product, partial [Gulo gulo]
LTHVKILDFVLLIRVAPRLLHITLHIFKYVYLHVSTFKLSQKSKPSEGTDSQSETFLYAPRELDSPRGQDSR